MPVMMDKSTVIQMMQSDFVQICRERSNLSKQMKDSEEDVREYMKDLLAQVKSGSLIVVAKTPNVSNIRNISSSIQMIPENEEIELLSLSSACNNTELILEVSNACSGRAKRGASIKATDKIKMQQSIHINDKLRRPSKEDDELLTRKKSEARNSKKSIGSCENVRPSEQIKMSLNKKSQIVEEIKKRESHKRKLNGQDTDHDSISMSEKPTERASKRLRLTYSSPKEQNTNTRQVNGSVGVNNADISLAAINKDVTGTPIGNTNCEKKQSRVNYATVLIEPLPSFKKSANQTFMITNTVLKELSMLNNTSRNRSETRVSQDDGASAGLKNSRESSKSIIVLEQKKRLSQVNHRNTDNALPEGRQSSLQRRNATSNNSFLVSDVDEVQGTPPKQKGLKSICEVKSGYKPKVLFNPYAPNSVKKRVQAFEEVAVSPKKVETGCVAKNTRKNTRALAETFESPTEVQSISEKYEKKRQLKANPYCKRRLLLGQILTSKNHLLTPSKAQTVINILLNRSCVDNVTRVDAPIQATKSSSNSVNKASEEKKRHAHNEDARQKREALLKLDAEEKKRKREEKELRNKLSREAQEKLELEKRLKAKREKEEKAKLAQQMQDKQKVLMERRRLLQVQRAQEKEEKRRQEELIRLQRLQDQEEQERLLAELKRQEQELEKRKQALKMKNKQVKAAAAQKQGTNYHKIDSIPANNTDDRSETLYLTQESVQELTAWQKYISPDIRLKYFGVENRDCHYFKHLNSKRLKRTSSACWETPLE